VAVVDSLAQALLVLFLLLEEQVALLVVVTLITQVALEVLSQGWLDVSIMLQQQEGVLLLSTVQPIMAVA
jgi:hypothetical protein